MKNNLLIGLLTIIMISLFGCMLAIGVNIFNDIVQFQVQEANNDEDTIEKFVSDEVVIGEIKENVETPEVKEETVTDDLFSFEPKEEIQYTSSESTRNTLYVQLNNYSKTIYDGLVNNKDNIKTGAYTIEFGKKFNDVLMQNDGQKVLGEYYQSAIEAFTYDNPDVFYLNPTKMYLNIQTITRGSKKDFNVYLSNQEGENYLADGFTSKEQINQYQEQVRQVKDSLLSNLSGNTYNKVKQIHDYLVENISYDTSISKNNIYDVYGALINRECVCEGYAKAFKYLTNEAGINSVIVVGEATNRNGQSESHSWNYVEIDGIWYGIDCTWDDPVVQDGIRIGNEYKYRYFLKGLNTLNSDHFPTGRFTTNGMNFNYPQVSVNDYR